MILAFNHEFKPLILSGIKVHSIRQDAANRWKAGNTIQMATGVRTKSYVCFFESTCVSTQRIDISYKDKGHYVDDYAIFIDGQLLPESRWEELAKKDGFENVVQFIDFFADGLEDGKLIHWTNLKY